MSLRKCASTLLTDPDRSYRDRKDKYTKSLEVEMVRAHANEASLMSRIQRLRDIVQVLARLLTENGISIPADSGWDDELYGVNHNTIPDSVDHLIGVKGGLLGVWERGENTVVAFPEDGYEAQGLAETKSSLEIISPDVKRVSSVVEARMNPRTQQRSGGLKVSAAATSPRCRGLLRELDPVILGMEFVLTYVALPCLNET